MKAVDAAFSPYREVWSRVESLVKFPSGRWDLHLRNETVVKLPVEDLDTALIRLTDLDRETFILSRDVGVIDMRLHDRIGLTSKSLVPAQSS